MLPTVIDELDFFIGSIRAPEDNREDVYTGFENKTVFHVMESGDAVDLTDVTRIQITINNVVHLDSDTDAGTFLWGPTLPASISTQTDSILATLGDGVIDPGVYYAHLVIWEGGEDYIVTSLRHLILDVKSV